MSFVLVSLLATGVSGVVDHAVKLGDKAWSKWFKAAALQSYSEHLV